jgi:hypothetical protein
MGAIADDGAEVRVDRVLTGLQADGTLSAEQCQAVRAAFGADAALHEPTLHAPGGDRLRPRLLEAASYLGAVLVAASLIALLAQRWNDLSQWQQVGMLGALAALALLVGGLVAGTATGGRAALLLPAAASRRRVASVAFTAGALLVGAAVGTALLDAQASGPISVGATLALLVVAQRVAPSALTEVALLGATLTFVSVAVEALIGGAGGEEEFVIGDAEPDPLTIDYAMPISLATVGVVWAAAVAPRLRLPEMGRVLGLAAALWATVPLAATQGTRTAGLLVLAAISAIGLGAYLRTRLWPWLAAGALAVAIFVVILVGQSAGTAAGLLLAGLLLLGAAGWAAWRARHHPSSAAEEPANGLVDQVSTRYDADHRPESAP